MSAEGPEGIQSSALRTKLTRIVRVNSPYALTMIEGQHIADAVIATLFAESPIPLLGQVEAAAKRYCEQQQVRMMVHSHDAPCPTCVAHVERVVSLLHPEGTRDGARLVPGDVVAELRPTLIRACALFDTVDLRIPETAKIAQHDREVLQSFLAVLAEYPYVGTGQDAPG